MLIIRAEWRWSYVEKRVEHFWLGGSIKEGFLEEVAFLRPLLQR